MLWYNKLILCLFDEIFFIHYLFNFGHKSTQKYSYFFYLLTPPLIFFTQGSSGPWTSTSVDSITKAFLRMARPILNIQTSFWILDKQALVLDLSNSTHKVRSLG